MSIIAKWWKRLTGQKPVEDDNIIQIGDLRLVPSGKKEERSEQALPGTKDLKPILELVPPPIDPELVNSPEPEPERDYGPDPIAEWSLTFEARERFDCAALAEILHARHEDFGRPTYFVRTVEGQVTYMVSSDAPPFGIALIPAWSLGNWFEPDKTKVFAGAQALEKALSALPEGFQSPDISLEALGQQMDQAARIKEIGTERVTVVAHHPDGKFWNGRDIWVLLHQLGLTWGDMDCFQWVDPTHQTDYLIWVEVDDGDLGYALPERIAAGEQHFRAIRFSFKVPRSPAPLHVLRQLEAMTAACQDVLSCNLSAFLDDTPVSGSDELRDEVVRIVEYLDSLGVKPGSSSVCRLI